MEQKGLITQKNRIPERHDLLFVTDAGRKYAVSMKQTAETENIKIPELYEKIPYIFTGRINEETGGLQVGISYPLRSGSMRYREASEILSGHILQIVTPEQAFQLSGALDTHYKVPLKLLSDISEKADCLGIFGSAAMEAVTGLPYLHAASDLDILIHGMNAGALETFYKKKTEIERKYKISFDVELKVEKRCYIKLEELMSSGKYVLAKGGKNPVIRTKQEILDKL